MNASPVSVNSLSVHPKLVSAAMRGRAKLTLTKSFSMNIVISPAGLLAVDKLLHCTEAELVGRTGLSLGEVRELILSASEAVIADHPVNSALQLFLNKKALPNYGDRCHYSSSPLLLCCSSCR